MPLDGPLKRTDKGNQCLQDRDAGKRLPARLRGLLLLVDGVRTGAELKRLAVEMGTPEICLAQLATLRLIEPLHAPKPDDIKWPAAPAPTPAQVLAAKPAPFDERSALVAALSAALDEAHQAAPANLRLAARPSIDSAASLREGSGDLPPMMAEARQKMLVVASLIPGEAGASLRAQVAACDGLSALHAALLALRRAMKTGYRDHDADAILQPIERMLPPMPQ
jgi:hypothetical protein